MPASPFADGQDKSSLSLDPDDITAVYEELEKLQVALDPDPLPLGPKRMNHKIAEARGMLSRCELVFMDTAQRLHTFKRALRIRETAFQLKLKHLYTHDPEVRAGRSQSDREAHAYEKLPDDVTEVNRLGVAVEDLESVLVVIKAKRSDLRDIQARLRDQMRLCQEEVNLGQKWGTKLPPGMDLDLSDAAAADSDDTVDDLLGKLDGEIHLGAQDGSWRDPVPMPHEEEFEVDPETEPEPEKTPETEPEPEKTPEVGNTAVVEEDVPSEDPLQNMGDGNPEKTDEKDLPPTSDTDVVDSFLDDPDSVGERSVKPNTDMDDGMLDDLLGAWDEAK